ncbi:hypothetical protein HMPREF0058_0830 [Actinomyces urogenitalis DSM 15434]|uniref:Uncharacterized protein n=1 Tax=Actinomyces urogenitalis DSM 15434 TaxID=525246 RepID=C0W4M2_9ACTO|nr:hypothetical protein HMPREF0058_0830 [Actinomyces urogenitalis DSM 15434]
MPEPPRLYAVGHVLAWDLRLAPTPRHGLVHSLALSSPSPPPSRPGFSVLDRGLGPG